MAFKKAKKWIVYAVIVVMSGNLLQAMQEREVKTMSLDEVFAEINAKTDKELTLNEAYSLIWSVLHDPDTYLSDTNSVVNLMHLAAPIIAKTKSILDNPDNVLELQIQNAMVGNAILYRLLRLKFSPREREQVGTQYYEAIKQLNHLLPITIQNKLLRQINGFLRRTSAWADTLQLLDQFHKGINPSSKKIEGVLIRLRAHKPTEKEKELINSLKELLISLLELSPEKKEREMLEELLYPFQTHLAVPLITQESGDGEGPGGIPFPVGGGREGEEALRRAAGLPPAQPTSWTTWAKRLAGVAGASSLSKILYDYWQKSEREKTKKSLDSPTSTI